MAKTGFFDSDPTQMARAAELKRELQKLINTIADDDDYPTETIDRANDALLALKELKLRTKKGSPLSFNLQQPQQQQQESVSSAAAASCPEEFKCPLSKELMRDPVILCTGQTYDRPFIVKWLESGNRTCPLTQQVLSHTNVTPNHLIREMISHWCKSQGVELLDPIHYVNEAGITEADRNQFRSLLEKLSSLTQSEQMEAAKELRQLTKRMPSFRALFGEIDGAIAQLLSPLSGEKTGTSMHPDLQENVITTLLNLSIHDDNKKLVAETPSAMPVLMEALRAGTIATRTNAAAALFTLSALDSNKALIGKCGAFGPLINLLHEGNPLAMKDVASAIYNLCLLHENRARAVKEEAVVVILGKIRQGVLVNELLAILAMLCTNQAAIIDMGNYEGVACLLHMIRESTSERSKENCIAILHTICFYDRTKWKDVREEEKAHGTISKLAEQGTSRAKRKAGAILERMNRAVNFTNTA